MENRCFFVCCLRNLANPIRAQRSRALTTLICTHTLVRLSVCVYRVYQHAINIQSLRCVFLNSSTLSPQVGRRFHTCVCVCVCEANTNGRSSLLSRRRRCRDSIIERRNHYTNTHTHTRPLIAPAAIRQAQNVSAAVPPAPNTMAPICGTVPVHAYVHP